MIFKRNNFKNKNYKSRIHLMCFLISFIASSFFSPYSFLFASAPKTTEDSSLASDDIKFGNSVVVADKSSDSSDNLSQKQIDPEKKDNQDILEKKIDLEKKDPPQKSSTKKSKTSKFLSLDFDIRKSQTEALNESQAITDEDKLLWISIDIKNRSSSDNLFDVVVELEKNSCLEVLDLGFNHISPKETSSALKFTIKNDIELHDSSEFIVPAKINNISKDKVETIKVIILEKNEDKNHKVKTSSKEVFIKHISNDIIIIVPGIAGSEIFSSNSQRINGVTYAQDHRIWPPEDTSKFIRKNAKLIDSIDDIIDIDVGLEEATSSDANIPSAEDFEQDRCDIKFMGIGINRILRDFKNLCCDKDGMSKLKTRKSYPFDCREESDSRFYGSADVYANLAETLKADKQLSNYKIVFFSYDWRQPNSVSAKELENYLDQNHYDNVVLVSHSMGGLVCTSFLSKPENQEKINKFISLGTPFLGAHKAINVIETGEFFDGLIGTVIAPIANDLIKNISSNCPSIYELFPPEQLFKLSKSGHIFEKLIAVNRLCCCRKVKTQPVTDFLEYSQILANQFRRSVPNIDMFLNSAQQFHNTLYDETGKSVLLSDKFDFYNIIGTNIETIGKNQIYYEYEGDTPSLEYTQEANGDGTVTFESATINNTLPKDKLYKADNVEHISLVSEPAVLDLLKNIIKNKPEVFDDSKITID